MARLGLETGLHSSDCTRDETGLHRRRATRVRAFSRHDTRPNTRLKSSTRESQEKGMGRQGQREREREMAQMDAGMGRDAALHNDSEALRIAIIAETFLSKIDGSTTALAHLLQHLAPTRVRAILLGPESGMREYPEARLFGTFGVPLRAYPGLKINFASPAFLRSSGPQVIHLVDPIWLGVLARRAGPHGVADIVPEYPDRDEPPYDSADACGDPWVSLLPPPHVADSRISALFRTALGIHWLPPLVGLLREKGWGTQGLGVWVFSCTDRYPALRLAWGAAASDVVILSMGRLSPGKNLNV
ncbi:hypothetical protein B0H13DRAFT_146628 [Mycena leptocephala]|nr:hypothetical protein B0H13DRAFT_146628 [Mycena leptocephala]